MRALPLALVMLLGAACAPQPMRAAGEPRWPQTTINAKADKVRAAILPALASHGTITQATDYLLKAEGPMGPGQATTARLFFGCGTCGEPKQVLQFILAETAPNQTAISVQYWNEIDTPRQGWQRHEINSQAAYDDINAMLGRLKQQVESTP